MKEKNDVHSEEAFFGKAKNLYSGAKNSYYFFYKS